MLDRMVAVLPRTLGLTPGRAERGRKVRTPESSVPDNVREDVLKHVRRKVPQKTYRPGRKPEVRVKRCGKSAPPAQQCAGQGKPHTEQDQIGKEPGWSGERPARAGSLELDARAKQAQAVAEPLKKKPCACRLGAPNFRVGRLSRPAMAGLEE